MLSFDTVSFDTPCPLGTFDIEALVVKFNASAMEAVVAILAFDSEAFFDTWRDMVFCFGHEDPDVFFFALVEVVPLGC